MAVVKTLEMVFRNAAGKEVTISVADPKDDVTQVQAFAVMQDIIAKKIFTSKGGELSQIVDARVRTRDAVSLT